MDVAAFLRVLTPAAADLRLIGIQLSEPFGYEARHLQVPEYLMRGFISHRELLADAALPIAAGGMSPVDTGESPDFCAPFEAAYDKGFATYMKTAQATKQLTFAQERFGFAGITAEDRDKGEAQTAIEVDKSK